MRLGKQSRVEGVLTAQHFRYLRGHRIRVSSLETVMHFPCVTGLLDFLRRPRRLVRLNVA